MTRRRKSSTSNPRPKLGAGGSNLRAALQVGSNAVSGTRQQPAHKSHRSGSNTRGGVGVGNRRGGQIGYKYGYKNGSGPHEAYSTSNGVARVAAGGNNSDLV